MISVYPFGISNQSKWFRMSSNTQMLVFAPTFSWESGEHTQIPGQEFLNLSSNIDASCSNRPNETWLKRVFFNSELPQSLWCSPWIVLRWLWKLLTRHKRTCNWIISHAFMTDLFRPYSPHEWYYFYDFHYYEVVSGCLNTSTSGNRVFGKDFITPSRRE
jgi:hypothetical protein